MREYHVRFCERLRGKFPRSTHLLAMKPFTSIFGKTSEPAVLYTSIYATTVKSIINDHLVKLDVVASLIV